MSQKYNRIMPESEGNVLAVEIGERITLEEYQEIFADAAATLLPKYEESRLLLNYTKDFYGWDIEAAEIDLGILSTKGHLLSKIALVNPPEKVLSRWLVLKPILGGELRIFTQVDEAINWVKS